MNQVSKPEDKKACPDCPKAQKCAIPEMLIKIAGQSMHLGFAKEIAVEWLNLMYVIYEKCQEREVL